MLRIGLALATLLAISTTADAQTNQPNTATLLIEEVCDMMASPNLQGAIDKVAWFSDKANGQVTPDVRVVFIAAGQRITIRCFPGSGVFGPSISIFTHPNGSNDRRLFKGTDWYLDMHNGPTLDWKCVSEHMCDLLEPTLLLAQKTLRP